VEDGLAEGDGGHLGFCRKPKRNTID
jgi:hypothetical protein